MSAFGGAVIARANDRLAIVAASDFSRDRGQPFAIRVQHSALQSTTTSAFSVADAIALRDALQAAIDGAAIR